MRKGYKPGPTQKFYRLNNQITAKEVRLLDDEGKQIGIMPIGQALQLSLDQSLDLVEIAQQAEPPVVKLIDYRKFLYQEKKRKQEEKKNAHVTETKQIRFGPFIDEHDLGIKIDRAREFIAEGDKVKFIIKFQGRAITKQDLGHVILQKVIKAMEDVAKVDREVHMEGRQMVVVLSKGGIVKNEESKETKIEDKGLSGQAV